MRTLLLKAALCAAILLAPTSAGAQDKEFKKLKKIDGVEHVHIPKFLISLAAKNGEGLNLGGNVSLGDYWTGDLLKKIEAVDVFTSENEQSATQMGKRVQSIMNGKGWESLVDVKDEDGEKVKIFQAKQGKQTTFVIFAEEEKEATLVVIKGEVDMDKLLEQQMAVEGENTEKQ